MRPFTRLRLRLVLGAALAVLAPAASADAAAAAPTETERLPAVVATDCPLLDPPPSQEDLERYLCGDPRLGPADLPDDGVVGELMHGYQRLGGLSPTEFLNRYRRTSTDPRTGEAEESWIYPAHQGFATVGGVVQSWKVDVAAGTMLDRFGSPWGSFLAPAGTPYAQRSLPPDSLNTWPGGPAHNYRCYQVLDEFTAEVGPIAPAFEQPGGGDQLFLDPALVPEGTGLGHVGVNSLAEWGYVEDRPAEDCAVSERVGLAA
ncbi:TNT domain-containing protein [Nocardiopsis rhodophaea]|uniref:TNT domain-containing protein n=1 Tax=Nocardiopsis rhodophaea TaxID=280238 RepID=UPI0031D88DA2